MENEIDQVLSLISRLGAEVDIEEYRQFLRDLIGELRVMLEAA